jgi:hypothetical protein
MLAGWKKYRTITIDHTNITADIANYPLFLNLSAAGGIGDVDLTSIFTELGASQLKLAVADATDAECYVEEVNWDSATPFAELWAQIPSVSTAADTVITIYYDSTHADNSTYVGVTGSVPGKAVWDANFKAVYHMNDLTTSTIADSTGSGYTGTKGGANNPLEEAGLIGKAQNFSSDRISGGDVLDYNLTDAQTTEITAHLNTTAGIQTYISKERIGSPYQGWIFYTLLDQATLKYEYIDDAGKGFTVYSTNAVLNTNWQYLALSNSNKTVAMYVAGATVATTIADATPANVNTAVNMCIGARENTNWYFNGVQDEIRFSTIARSAAYIKANNYCFTDALVTFGAETEIVAAADFLVRLNHWPHNFKNAM